MPRKLQRVLNVLQRLLAILFGFFMLIEGSKFSYKMLESNIPGIGVPSALLYVVVPASGALVIIYLVSEFLGFWQGVKEESEVEG
jgi:TRAP-type transport system small permease protein